VLVQDLADLGTKFGERDDLLMHDWLFHVLDLIYRSVLNLLVFLNKALVTKSSCSSCLLASGSILSSGFSSFLESSQHILLPISYPIN
jgi:hypothetical protein